MSCQSILGARTQARLYGRLRREWDHSQWLTGVCGICHITQSYICAQYEISFICVFLTNLNSGQKGLTNSKFLPFMCSIRFLLSSILNPWVSFMISWWVRFASVSLLLLHSNTWNLTLGLVVTLPTTSTDLWRIFVTLISGVVWTSLPLIKPDRGYNELTLTSNTLAVTTQCEPTQYQGQVVKAILDNLPLLHTRGILFIKAISESWFQYSRTLSAPNHWLSVFKKVE